MRIGMMILALALAAPAMGAAQQRAPGFTAWQATVPGPVRPAPGVEPAGGGRSTPRLVVGGLLGGGVGLGLGALVGGALGGGDTLCGDDPCGLAEAIFGAIGGEVALLPLGVHLANGRRGNYLLSLLASAGVAAGGLALSGGGDHGEVLAAVPVLQIVTSILIERGT